MKKSFLGTLALLALSCAVWGGGQDFAAKEEPFLGDARPRRSIVIGKEKVLTLTASNAEIVVAPDAYKTIQYAARELKTYLSRRLGGDIPVVTEPTEGKISLMLGISSWSKADGIDDGALCRDGFFIKTKGRRLYLVGRDDPREDMERNDRFGGIWGTLQEHATLFAVYDFLERFGGVRFYFPYENGVYVPPAGSLDLPEINLFDRPDYEARNVSTYSNTTEDDRTPNKANPGASSLAPSKNIESKRIRLQSKYIPNCHGSRTLNHIPRFKESHPEYFALLKDGRRYFYPSLGHIPHLCYSSEVMEVFKKDALAVLKNTPPQEYDPLLGKSWNPSAHLPGKVFGFMPQDGFFCCTCPKCTPHFATPQGTSEFLWDKTAALARYVAEQMGPGYYVSQMAYSTMRPVPNVELPDNVLVMLALQGPFSLKSKGAFEEEVALIHNWNKKLKGKKVWLWNYTDKWGMRGVPNLAHHLVGQYYSALKNDIYGAYMESTTDNFLYNYLNYYVFGKVTWNTDTDVEALLKEHYALLFGKAATVMEEIYNDFETCWTEKIATRAVETPLGPVMALPTDDDLWNVIYSPEHLERLEAAFDNAEALAAAQPEALAHVRYFRRNFLDPLKANSAEYLQRNNAIGDLKASLPATLHLSRFYHRMKPLVESFQSTQVNVRVENGKLCVRFDCEEPDMADVTATNRERDDGNIWRDNEVEIFINPSGDRKNCYHLLINSKGSLGDIYQVALGKKMTHDNSWDSKAGIAISEIPNGWRADVSIPLDSFKEPMNPKGFVANFTRNRVTEKGGCTMYSWSPFLVSTFNELDKFGTLTLEPEPTAENIVINPDFNGTRQGRGICHYWMLNTSYPEGVTMELDKTCFVRGSQALKMSNSNKDKPALYVVTQGATGRLKPNTRYKVSYLLKTQDITPVKKGGGVCLNIWNGKNYWLPDTKFTGTHNWFRQSFEFTSTDKPDEPTYIKPVLFHCTGTAWFDHITIEPCKD